MMRHSLFCRKQIMLKKLTLLSLIMPGLVLAVPERDYPNRNSPEASIYRGQIVYENYCVLCHGLSAEGNGRASKIYNPKPSNLRQTLMPRDYLEKIIRKGGKENGRSEFMPPWNEELTEEQITDILNYIGSLKGKP